MSSLSNPARSGPNSRPARSPRPQTSRNSTAAPRAVSTGLMIWRGRGQVANTWCRSATASATLGMHGGGLQQAVGTGGSAPGLLLRPAVARGDQAEVKQSAIGHGAGAGTDIVGQLRADEDHHRGVADRPPGRHHGRGRSWRRVPLPPRRDGKAQGHVGAAGPRGHTKSVRGGTCRWDVKDQQGGGIPRLTLPLSAPGGGEGILLRRAGGR